MRASEPKNPKDPSVHLVRNESQWLTEENEVTRVPRLATPILRLPSGHP